MNLLSDAEYDKLTPRQQTDYWRARFYLEEEVKGELAFENFQLREALRAIGDRATRALADTA